MLAWFWSFVTYSFCGFLLEGARALWLGEPPDRRGLRTFPLCPVYGAGACLILLLPGWVDARPPLLFLLGGGAASLAEYLAAWYHEKVLGVSFWSYEGRPGNLRGRVCPLYSAAWGLLALGLVYAVHPALAPLLAAIPAPVGWTFLCAVALDALLLRRAGDPAALRRRSVHAKAPRGPSARGALSSSVVTPRSRRTRRCWRCG